MRGGSQARDEGLPLIVVTGGGSGGHTVVEQ